MKSDNHKVLKRNKSGKEALVKDRKSYS